MSLDRGPKAALSLRSYARRSGFDLNRRGPRSRKAIAPAPLGSVPVRLGAPRSLFHFAKTPFLDSEGKPFAQGARLAPGGPQCGRELAARPTMSR